MSSLAKSKLSKTCMSLFQKICQHKTNPRVHCQASNKPVERHGQWPQKLAQFPLGDCMNLETGRAERTPAPSSDKGVSKGHLPMDTQLWRGRP